MKKSFDQTTLDAIVIKTTDAAVLIDRDGREIWIPRKVCLGGDTLEEDDTDIVVADWWLQREGLL